MVVEISSTGDQMLAVLEMVAQEGPISAAQAARLCRINRTVTHRLLTTLAQRSFVRRTDRGYTLGPALAHLGRLADIGLERMAKPFMMKLAQETEETVVLHIVDHLEAVVVEQALGSRHLVRVEHTPGSRHSLCRGASGWALLAFQPEKAISRVLKDTGLGDEAHARIREIREQGFAVSHDELQMGVYGIAAPILDRDGSCPACIAILIPSVRAENILDLKDHLLGVSAELCEAFQNG